MIEQLLIPLEEGVNQHKRLQLRELAELNGALLLFQSWQASLRCWMLAQSQGTGKDASSCGAAVMTLCLKMCDVNRRSLPHAIALCMHHD